MKYIILSVLLMTGVATAQHSNDHDHDHDHKMSVARKPLKAAEKTAVTSILDKNDELFNAFLKKDNALVEKKAKALSEAASQAKMGILKDIQAQTGKLSTISGSKSHEANMEAYESFLKPLIKFVQTYEVDKKFNIFSCPMVKKSWIQDTSVNKDVQNIYAMEMLECGTQDTKF